MTKHLNGKKLLSTLLVIVMLMSMLPTAFAAQDDSASQVLVENSDVVSEENQTTPSDNVQDADTISNNTDKVPADDTSKAPADGTDNAATDGTDNAATDGTAKDPADSTDNPATDGTAKDHADGTDNAATDDNDNAATDGTAKDTADGTDNAAPPAKTEISVIALESPKAPAAGDDITVYSPAVEGCTVSSQWLAGETVAEGKFAADTEYTLVVTITADKTHSFAEGFKLTLDGEDMPVTAVMENAASIRFSKTYSPAAKLLTVGADQSFKTIQEAIDFIASQSDADGWTVKVLNGKYDRFSVNKPVSNLLIEGESRDGVIINTLTSAERFAEYDNGGINIWAPNATLKNMTVNADSAKNVWSDAAISTNHSHSGGSGNSLTVDSCTVNGSGVGYGIFWNCDRLEVINSSISNFPNAIEYMLDNYSIPTGQTYRISNNTISNCSFAIHGYLGGNNGGGTLEISNNTVTGSDSLRAKIIVQDNAKNSLTVDIKNNTLSNAIIGTVNLRDEGDSKSDILSSNSFGTGCFAVEAIEPGTIEYYTTYKAPEGANGHWELFNTEGITNLDFVKKAIIDANKAGSHTLSITGIPDGDLIETFTWFKDAIYWVTDPEPQPPVDPLPPTNPDWAVSRSKTATNLDENFISNVSLSLPSAEENLKTDIVFVFDESSCGEPVRKQVGIMLDQLYKHEAATDAAIQIGAVQFRGEATEFPLTPLNDNTKDKLSEFMATRPKVGGSNMSMGILAAEQMLDADTTVDASRKYMILVSDGIAYIWDDPNTPERENIGVNFSNADTPNKPFLASPDGWDVKYGNGYVPADWNEHLTNVGIHLNDTISQKSSIYDRNADISNNLFVTPDEQWRYNSTVDIALFMANQAYQNVSSKYHTFAVMTGVESEMSTYPYGPSFMKYLANGKDVSFDGILKEVLYLVDAGSTVDDYMGYVEGDYNFDFINDAEKLCLTIGKTSYNAEKLSENKYGFKPVDGGYAYELEYIPGNMLDEEHFVWSINEPITNFSRVSLNYSVKLANPKVEAGTYGQYDRDGSQEFSGLYTNNSAVLHPIDSNGNQGKEQVFSKPTVSYTVAETPVTPDVPDPPETFKTELKKVWIDNNDTTKRSDKVVIILKADGKEIDRFTLSDENNWKVSLELPVYNEDGSKIVYSTFEKTNVKDYVASYSADGFTVYNTRTSAGPKTGDESNIVLWSMLLTVSAVSAAAAIYFLRKRRNNG